MWLALRWIAATAWILTRRRRPAVLLLGAPDHCNLGDHAQTYCWQDLLKRAFPGRRVAVFDMRTLMVANAACLRLLARTARPGDAVFVHSGYHTTDVWPIALRLSRLTTQLFRRHRIVFLPQTVNFLDPNESRAAAADFNGHGDVTIFCRDHQSLDIARSALGACDVRLMPDVVASLIGGRTWNQPREGIVLCLRDDKESLLNAQDRSRLAATLARSADVLITDTTCPLHPAIVARFRGQLLERLWEVLASRQVVVTDRFHGVVFSLIAGTPVVVLSSSDHKTTAALAWFGPEFSSLVHLAGSVQEATELVQHVIAAGPPIPSPDTLRREQFAGLEEVLAEVAL
jgi:exopolysaccharide biosynthesis predicted pyruvyltransferase EpsI